MYMFPVLICPSAFWRAGPYSYEILSLLLAGWWVCLCLTWSERVLLLLFPGDTGISCGCHTQLFCLAIVTSVPPSCTASPGSTPKASGPTLSGCFKASSAHEGSPQGSTSSVPAGPTETPPGLNSCSGSCYRGRRDGVVTALWNHILPLSSSVFPALKLSVTPAQLHSQYAQVP